MDINIKITCSGLQPLLVDSCLFGGINNDSFILKNKIKYEIKAELQLAATIPQLREG